MNNVDMKELGLTEKLIQEATKYEGLNIGRIISQYKDLYKVTTEIGELTAKVSGKFRYEAYDSTQFPVVGDFVMLEPTDNTFSNGIIHHVLSRKSVFSRKIAGTTTTAQIVASNIDTVFICMALNNDFNIRRLERYLSIAWDSGAVPVVVLTKSDLCEDIEKKLNELSSLTVGVDVLITTSMSDEGYLSVKKYIIPGKTVVFLGSSGVGKSTLINRLIGEEILSTQGLRNDDKGRHTTTRRELIVLPDGGMVIDTPGMRELGIINADFSKSFSDIEELALQCKFRDCTHTSEPHCAVKLAIENGTLSRDRLVSYNKLKKEAKYADLKAKQRERAKFNEMFKGVGGMKNSRKFTKESIRRKGRR